MAEAVDIRELNIRIEQQSGFVTNLVQGMDKVIVGQKHLVDSLLISLLNQDSCAVDRRGFQPHSVHAGPLACRCDGYNDLFAER